MAKILLLLQAKHVCARADRMATTIILSNDCPSDRTEGGGGERRAAINDSLCVYSYVREENTLCTYCRSNSFSDVFIRSCMRRFDLRQDPPPRLAVVRAWPMLHSGMLIKGTASTNAHVQLDVVEIRLSVHLR